MLNERQKMLVEAAMVCSPPLLTDDPVVNHAIDCNTAARDGEPDYDERIYNLEIEAWKASNGWLLSLSGHDA